MAYKIRYHMENKPENGRAFCIQAYLAAVLLICILAVHTFSPKGKAIVEKYLLPEDGKTVTALQLLVTQLEEGTAFFDAMDNFCDSLTDGT